MDPVRSNDTRPDSFRCLVTGATGFIGRHLVEKLVHAGATVRAVSRSADTLSSTPDVERVVADLYDLDSLEQVMSGVDVVYHLAGVGSPASSFADVPELFQVNAVGTHNVLEAARLSGVRRVVTASSAAVYGAIDSLAISEDAPLKPTSSYGLSKLAQEQACDMYSRVHGLETLSLRLFNVYGPGEDFSESNRKLIPMIVRKLLRSEPITLFGRGDQIRDFVYVDDVVHAMVSAAGAEVRKAIVLNIGTGIGTSAYQITQSLTTSLNKQASIDWQPARIGEVERSIAAIDLATETLGWVPMHTFESGISVMAGHLLGRRDSQQQDGRSDIGNA